MTVMQLLDELEQNNPYKHFCVDTVDRFYQMCFDYICDKMEMDHPSDLKYGKGYDAISVPLRKALQRLSNLNCGIIYLSHSRKSVVQIKDVDKEKYELTLPASVQKVILPDVDVILLARYMTDDDTGEVHRVLVSQGSEFIDGGTRWELPPYFRMPKANGFNQLQEYMRGRQPDKKPLSLKLNRKLKRKKED